MSNAEEATRGDGKTSPNIDAFCEWMRHGLRTVSDACTPPESTGKHFRQARIEMLRGVRDIIDRRIERLSRDKDRGTHVVVE